MIYYKPVISHFVVIVSLHVDSYRYIFQIKSLQGHRHSHRYFDCGRLYVILRFYLIQHFMGKPHQTQIIFQSRLFVYVIKTCLEEIFEKDMDQ